MIKFFLQSFKKIVRTIGILLAFQKHPTEDEPLPIQSESSMREKETVTALVEKKEKRKISVSDPIFQPIIMEILESYGYPQTSESCMNKSDKIMYIVALMSALQALQRDDYLTNIMVESDCKERVFKFLKSYFEKFGHHAIPY